MWICLNRAFFSIVTPAANKPLSKDLLVRARRKGDIEKVFPFAKVLRTPSRDYLYRAVISRDEVMAAISQEVGLIDYPNFKNSVSETPLKTAYGRVWSVMADTQETRPYSGTRRQTKLL